jgi:hypothetical protein
MRQGDKDRRRNEDMHQISTQGDKEKMRRETMGYEDTEIRSQRDKETRKHGGSKTK